MGGLAEIERRRLRRPGAGARSLSAPAEATKSRQQEEITQASPYRMVHRPGSREWPSHRIWHAIQGRSSRVSSAVEAATEAIDDNIGSFEPENMDDLAGFLAGLPGCSSPSPGRSAASPTGSATSCPSTSTSRSTSASWRPRQRACRTTRRKPTESSAPRTPTTSTGWRTPGPARNSRITHGNDHHHLETARDGSPDKA